jgi:hypothetical protein
MKKIYMGIAICLALATVGAAEDKTALAYWSSAAYIDASGNFYGTSFVGPATITDAAISGTITFGNGSTIAGTATSTTSRTSINIQPLAASTRSGVSRTSLVTIGDITGTTPFGFGVTNQSSYGILGSFGRTVAATANWDGNYDTGLDVRCLNKLVNDSAYNMRGAYIKAKNYISGGVTGVVGQLDGLTVECVADGTETESSIIKLGSDASTVTFGIDMDEVATPTTADIRFSNGGLIKNGDANTLTITEATVAIAGALTATTVTPANGITTNITISSTLSTNVMYFLGGILTNNVYTGP